MKEQNNDTPREKRERPERDEMDASREAAIAKMAQEAEDEFNAMNDIERTFVDMFEEMQNEAHNSAVKHGWWDDYYQFQVLIDQGLTKITVPINIDPDTIRKQFGLVWQLSKIALVHSELGELTEGIRHGNPPDQHLPLYSQAEVEAADVIIRLMDLSEQYGWRLAEAIVEKMKYNNTRPYKHGKLA